jgi:hypothetical protein
MQQILARHSKPVVVTEEATLPENGFRSLGFSEFALGVDTISSRPLNFDAPPVRAIRHAYQMSQSFWSKPGRMPIFPANQVRCGAWRWPVQELAEAAGHRIAPLGWRSGI